MYGIPKLFLIRKNKYLLVLALLGFVFQFSLWYFESGSVNIRGDVFTYLYLAYEILGEVQSSPVFDMRSPGWPLTIALLLRVFGIGNVWILGLFQRLLLTIFPVLFFSIISRDWDNKYHIPFLLSLVVWILPINRDDAIAPLTEITYTFLGLLFLFLVSRMIQRWGRFHIWFLVGLVLSYRVLIRIQALPAIALFLFAYVAWTTYKGYSFKKVTYSVLVIVSPVAFALAAWASHNYLQTGVLGFTTGVNHQTYFFVRSVDYKSLYIPTTNESIKIRELVPEIREDVMPFSTYPYYWIALYRAQVLWDMTALEFYNDYAAPATNQFLWVNRSEFVRYILKWASFEFIDFNFKKEETPGHLKNTNLPKPQHEIQLSIGSRLSEENLKVYEGIKTNWILDLFSVEKDAFPTFIDNYLQKDNYQDIESSFLFSGVAGVLSMLLLFMFTDNKLIVLSMLSLFFVDLMIPVYACGECISWARFQAPLEMLNLLSVLLFSSELLRHYPFSPKIV